MATGSHLQVLETIDIRPPPEIPIPLPVDHLPKSQYLTPGPEGCGGGLCYGTDSPMRRYHCTCDNELCGGGLCDATGQLRRKHNCTCGNEGCGGGLCYGTDSPMMIHSCTCDNELCGGGLCDATGQLRRKHYCTCGNEGCGGVLCRHASNKSNCTQKCAHGMCKDCKECLGAWLALPTQAKADAIASKRSNKYALNSLANPAAKSHKKRPRAEITALYGKHTGADPVRRLKMKIDRQRERIDLRRKSLALCATANWQSGRWP